MSVTKIPVGLPFAPSPDREAAIQRKEQRVKAKESELGEARKMRKATDDSLQAMLNRIAYLAQEEARIDRDILNMRKKAAEMLNRQGQRDDDIANTAKEILSTIPTTQGSQTLRPHTGRSSLVNRQSQSFTSGKLSEAISSTKDTTNPSDRLPDIVPAATSGASTEAGSRMLGRTSTSGGGGGAGSAGNSRPASGSGAGSRPSSTGRVRSASASRTSRPPSASGTAGAGGGTAAGAAAANASIRRTSSMSPTAGKNSAPLQRGADRDGTAAASTSGRSPAPLPGRPKLGAAAKASPSKPPIPAAPAAAAAASPASSATAGVASAGVDVDFGTRHASDVAEGMQRLALGSVGAGAGEGDLGPSSRKGATAAGGGLNTMSVLGGSQRRLSGADDDIVEELAASTTTSSNNNATGRTAGPLADGLQQFTSTGGGDNSGRRVVQVKTTTSRKDGGAVAVAAAGVGWGMSKTAGGSGAQALSKAESKALAAEVAKKKQIWKVRKEFGLNPTPLADHTAQVEETGAGAWG